MTPPREEENYTKGEPLSKSSKATKAIRADQGTADEIATDAADVASALEGLGGIGASGKTLPKYYSHQPDPRSAVPPRETVRGVASPSIADSFFPF